MRKIVLFISALLVTIACAFVFVGCGGGSGGGSGIDGDEFMNVAVSESGSLTWTKLNRAKKYEILNGKFGTGAPSRETTDCSFDLTVFSLKEGKNYMTLLGIEDNNELGETIEIEFAVYEMIIEIKGGVYTLYARSYSDEYLSLSGFEEKDGIITKYIQPTFYSDLGGATYTSMPKDIKINGDNIWGLYSDAEYSDECGSQIITGLKTGHNYYYIKLNDKNGTFLKGYRIDFYILDKIDVVLYSKTGEKLFETNVWENDALDMSILYANVGENDYIAYNFEPIERDVASVDIQKDASFRVISSDEYNLLKHFTVSYDGVLTKKADHNCDGIENLTIPAQICGRNVVTIGNGSDVLCNIKNLVISDGIKEIAGVTFRYSSTLETVSLPDSLTSIGTSAFDGCTGLTSIIIPDGVISLGDFAFRNCTRLTSVTIGNSVTSIGDSAFYGCEKLTRIIIPDNVTSIGRGAFSACTGLASINGSAENTSRAARQVSGCTFVVNITSGTSIGDSAFKKCTGLTNVNIPESVTDIADAAFSGCTSLTSVTIPDSVTSIGSSAFSGCTSLTSVTIPNTVTSIVYSTFRDCTSLTSVAIPDSVTSIGSSAFSGCTSLTSITIPNNITRIEDYLFYNCGALTKITIPDNVISIGQYAFAFCTRFTNITIPDSVEGCIDKGAFLGCTGLTSISGDVRSAMEVADQAKPASFSVNITSGKNIPSWAFNNCTGLTSITLPERLLSIGEYAFSGCTSLTSITISENVTDIANYAFYGCISLTSITIPNRVTYIGLSAFEGCTSLVNVVFKNAHGWKNPITGAAVDFSEAGKAAEILKENGKDGFQRN